GIQLPSTLSPQPWITLEGFGLLVLGLGWTAWLTSLPWNPGLRRGTMKMLALGIIVLAMVTLHAWWTNRMVPHWLHERGFSPFPNRNHTGHVYALGGILAMGCAANGLRR